MEAQLIKITEYCISYDIEPDFIVSLEDSGIITLVTMGTEKYVHEEQLPELERYSHLHYDLKINIEGIDAIRHLLHKVSHLQQEIAELKNQLHIRS